MAIQQNYGEVVASNLSSASVVKTGAGRCYNVSIITAGGTDGALHDCATTGAATAANKIANIPGTITGTVIVAMPFFAGLVYVPGTSQVAAICYA